MSSNKKQKENPTRTKKPYLNLKFLAILLVIAVIIVFICNIISNYSNKNKYEIKSHNKNEKQIDYFTKEGELTFNKKDSKYISKIDIEIAEDDRERSQGLMFRESMNEDQGMFFIFAREEYQSFWMRNTEISLDIIFVNSNEEIVI